MTKLVEENLTERQQWQKQWYDSIAHEWGLQPDDVVLLPTMSKNSWLSGKEHIEWYGKVDYEIDMPGRRKKFHINPLKKWYPPDTTSYFVKEEIYGVWRLM